MKQLSQYRKVENKKTIQVLVLEAVVVTVREKGTLNSESKTSVFFRRGIQELLWLYDYEGGVGWGNINQSWESCCQWNSFFLRQLPVGFIIKSFVRTQLPFHLSNIDLKIFNPSLSISARLVLHPITIIFFLLYQPAPVRRSSCFPIWLG